MRRCREAGRGGVVGGRGKLPRGSSQSAAGRGGKPGRGAELGWDGDAGRMGRPMWPWVDSRPGVSSAGLELGLG